MKPFVHSYRPPPPETYRLMLGCGTSLCKPRSVECSGAVVEPTRIKSPRTGDDMLKRIRSLVRPLQVELITRHPPCGGYVNIHRYMAAGSCIGVEVWQGPGLLGCPLEQQLTSLVEEWQTKDASTFPTAIIDSSTAKRRKVYFGCRDAYNDPQPEIQRGKKERRKRRKDQK
ncbi:hypothetical protein ABBQ38_004648 [Trebouxia sp. C0009 RCD-2024]